MISLTPQPEREIISADYGGCHKYIPVGLGDGKLD